ncbi:MAG: hypothetical protein H7234_08980 [Herminiimonas sp.]|nr:hypothetical protein [Herminiimonas sp.]
MLFVNMPAGNDGRIDIASGATLQHTSADLTNNAGGKITGAGTVDVGSNTLVNNGTIAPGDTATTGLLAIHGNLRQSAGGQTTIKLASSTDFDRLNVTGNITLDGTLNAALRNGYAPASGDSLPFLTMGGSSSGTFSSTLLPNGLQVGYRLYAGEAARLDYVSPDTGIKYFDNGAGDFDWSKPVNWTGDTLPVAGNDVVIDTGVRVTHASGTDQIRGLTIVGNNAVLISGGSLSVSGPTTIDGTLMSTSQLALGGAVSGAGILAVQGGVTSLASDSTINRLDIRSGILNATGKLTVNNQFNWSGGTLGGAGGLSTSANSTTTLSGVATVQSATWRNYGAVTISGNGSLALLGDSELPGALINQTSGVITDTSPFSGVSIYGQGPAKASFNNDGRFIKDGGSASSRQLYNLTLNNSGSIDVRSGALDILGNGFDSGTYTVGANSTLRFIGGARNLYPVAVFMMGSGATLEINNAAVGFGSALNLDAADATVTLNAGALNLQAGGSIAGTVNLVGGTLTDNGGLGIGGVLNWSNAAITGSGTLTTRAGATTNIIGSVALNDKTWNNVGTVNLSGGANLLLGGDGSIATTINNQGVFNVNDSAIGYTVTNLNKGFQNTGIFRKSTSLASGTDNINIPFNNSGTVTVASGTAVIDLHNQRNGTLDIASGATLRTLNDFTNDVGAVVSGSGALMAGGGSSTVINNGDISPGSANAVGRLTLQGNYRQGSSGRLNVRLAGNSNYDRLDVSGNVALDGTLVASTLNGYVPIAGDSFVFLTGGGNRTGTFSSTALPTNLQVGYNLFAGEAARLDYVSSGIGIKYFDNGVGDFDWSKPVNWSGDTVPVAGNDVVIDTNARITHASGTDQIRGFTIRGNSEVLVSGGSLTVLGPTIVDGTLTSSGQLALGGTLGGSGSVSVRGGVTSIAGDAAVSRLDMVGGTLSAAGNLGVNSLLNWSGGAISGAGVLSTGPGAGTSITNNATLLAKTWNNAGTVNLTGSGEILLNATTSTPAVFNNLASGTVNDNAMRLSPVDIGNGIHNATFNNNGVFNKNGGSLASKAISNVVFNNSGVVAVNSGTLRLFVDGTDTGTYSVPAGSTLQFDSNTRTLARGARLNVDGTLNFNGAEVISMGPLKLANGGATVNLSQGSLVAAGALSADGVLNISGGSLTANGGLTVPGTLNLSGGSVNDAGGLTPQGLFNWSGGMVYGSGVLTTGPTTVTNINGTGTTSTFMNGSYTLAYAPSGVTRLTNTTWDNAGTVNISGLLLMPGNSSGGTTVLNNKVGGVVNDISAQGAPIFSYYSGSFVEALHDTFNNAGTFSKTVTAAPLQIFTPRFNNTGTTNVTGRMIFDAGGTDAGTYNIASNSSAEFFVGTRNFETGTRVTGPGLLAVPGTVNINGAVSIGSSAVVNGGTLTLNSPLALGNALSLAGGTINAARPLTVSGAFTFSAGTIAGAGGIATLAGASTTISGAAALRDTVWNNGGNVYMQSSSQLNLGGSNATVFNNQAGAVFYDPVNGQSITTAGSAGTAFNNSGTFNKSSASPSGADVISVPFHNTGTLNVSSGANSFNLPDGNRGSVNVGTGATFGTISGDLVNQPGAFIGGTGTVRAGGGSATLVNNGLLAPGTTSSIGTLAVQGSFTQGSNGEMRVRLLSGDRFDRIDVTGNVALDGKLTTAAESGYVPAPGDGIAFLTLRGQRSGVFAKTDLPVNLRAGYSLFGGEAVRLDYVDANPAMQYFDNGAGDFNWANPVNWSSDSLPTASQDVLIDTNARVTHASGTDRIRGLTINGGSEVLVSGGSLGVTGSTAVDGKLAVAAGSLTLDGPLSGKGMLAVQGGTLALNGNAAISSLEMTGGLLTGTGTLNVTDSFEQTGGALVYVGGSVNIRQSNRALTVGNLEADHIVLTAVNAAIMQRDGTALKAASLTAQARQAITLDGAGNALASVSATATGNAPTIRLQSATPLSLGSIISTGGSVTLGSGGAISQSAGIDTASLRTVSTGGTILEGANTVARFSADNSGSGAIKLVNTSRPGTLTVLPVMNQAGGINIDNTGGVVTSGDVTAGNGSLTISAHSPITVNSTLTASDGINLNTFASPIGNDLITLNGTLLATGGGITLSGATDVLVASTASSTVHSGSPIDLSATIGSVTIRQGAIFNGAIPNIREGTPSTPTPTPAQTVQPSAPVGFADTAVNETLRTTVPVEQGASGVLTLAAISITGASIVNAVDAPTVGGTADNFGGIASESDAAREQANADPAATALAAKLGIGADGKPLRALPVCN